MKGFMILVMSAHFHVVGTLPVTYTNIDQCHAAADLLKAYRLSASILPQNKPYFLNDMDGPILLCWPAEDLEP